MTIQRKILLAALGLATSAGIALADAGHKENPKKHIMDPANAGMHSMMGEGMLALPKMDAARGRILFVEKGCVVCHSVNGVGGDDAPALDAGTMEPMMNPFEFAAKMWRGAEAMVTLQRDELGEQIELTGQELADIIAFAHNHAEQEKLEKSALSDKIKELIKHDD